MFANTQMMGLDPGFPDASLAPTPAPALAPALGPNASWPDACLTPSAPSPVPMPYPNQALSPTNIPFVPQLLLSMLPSFTPDVHPSVAGGGIMPGPAMPSLSAPSLPSSFLPILPYKGQPDSP